MSSIKKIVTSELDTLRDVVRWATSQFNSANLFYGHGNADAYNDALQLILYSLHLPTNEFPEQFADAKLTQSEKEKIAELLERRIHDRIPVPYLINEAWFAGLPFFVDERVLIPRSPFAELIHEHFSPWISDPDSVSNILDMCTGSACIAIACAEAFPDANVNAVDISQDALTVAQLNIEKHDLIDRVKLIQSDLWINVPPEQQYDIIVCNPPYVGAEEMASLPDEYRHEPASALEAEDNGLALVEKILLNAANYLSDHGQLFVEVGNSDYAVMERWPDIEFLWIDFEFGGHGLFCLDKTQCKQFTDRYSKE